MVLDLESICLPQKNAEDSRTYLYCTKECHCEMCAIARQAKGVILIDRCDSADIECEDAVGI